MRNLIDRIVVAGERRRKRQRVGAVGPKVICESRGNVTRAANHDSPSQLWAAEW
jgi:hypothetical protein